MIHLVVLSTDRFDWLDGPKTASIEASQLAEDVTLIG